MEGSLADATAQPLPGLDRAGTGLGQPRHFYGLSMSYATATELLIRFDSDEISQRADRMVPRLVTDEMLRIAAAVAI